MAELLVALALTAFLISLAIPSFNALVGSVRITSASNDLLGAIHLARGEAMKRRHRVVVCKSAEGQACTGSGGWQQGWIVFADRNSDGQRSPGEQLLHRAGALDPSMRLTGNATLAAYVSYAPDGATRSVGGGFQAGTLTVCRIVDGGSTARQIVISAGGRPRTQRVSVASCG